MLPLPERVSNTIFIANGFANRDRCFLVGILQHHNLGELYIQPADMLSVYMPYFKGACLCAGPADFHMRRAGWTSLATYLVATSRASSG